MKFQLVLRWAASSREHFDEMVEVEDLLISQLNQQHKVDGHDFGSGDTNIFVFTNDPQAAFEEISQILVGHRLWQTASAVYREREGEDHEVVLWPKGATIVREERSSGLNSFSLGSQIGGPDTPAAVLRQEQRLRNAFNSWTGNYTSAVQQFAFLLRVDGSLIRYTEAWRICGAQPAKRKRDWLEVEVGVPEAWWQDGGIEGYKKQLAEAIDNGFQSMVELLKRNKDEIDSVALLRDWAIVRHKFMGNPV